MVGSPPHILWIHDLHCHRSKYTKCLYDLINVLQNNNNKTTFSLFMHQSMLKIDLNVNIKDAVIWDLTPHNSVTYDLLDYTASKNQKL
jgi:hypothetical protein